VHSQKRSSMDPFRLRLFVLDKKRMLFPLRLLPPDEEGRKSSTFSLPTVTKLFIELLPHHVSSPFTRRHAFHRLSTAARNSAPQGTFGYFTFNFVSSALTALRQLAGKQSPASTAGREEKGRSRGSRVEIIVVTLIIYLPPALTSA